MESSIHPIILHNGASGVTRVRVDDHGMTLQHFGTGATGFKEIHLSRAEMALLCQALVPSGQSAAEVVTYINAQTAGLPYAGSIVDRCGSCGEPLAVHQVSGGKHRCTDAYGAVLDTWYR